jgi:GntR family transcriptional regulator/MocR family aminotransferase
MRYRIDKNSNIKAYMQLYYQLREDITSGAYPYGSKLPSKRLISEECGVSVITAEHAYSILCDEGYAEAKQKKGYFVIYKRDDFIASPAKSKTLSKTVIAHNGNNEFPFSVLSKTMRKVLSEYGESILVKSPNQGCPELREAIAGYLARSNGMSVHCDQIVIGAGTEYLYGLIVQLLGKDAVFALEYPSYEKIRKVYLASGALTELLKLESDGIASSELAKTSATVLHVTPFNSFPSGISADASKRNEYIRWAEKRNGYVIEDNYDSELTVSKKNEDTLYSLSLDGKVIYLNTFSRTVAPSIRVGYMILPQRLLERFQENLGFYSCTVPVFEQYVLAELINSGDFERHINRVRRIRRSEVKKG